MVGLANEAFEPENTSDELSAIKYNTKQRICKPLFRFFVTKNIRKSRDPSISALTLSSYYSITPKQAGKGWDTDPWH